MKIDKIKNLYTTLGVNIRDARKKAGLRQEELALMMDLSRTSIVNIEKGRQRPTLHFLYQFCAVANCKILDLLPFLEIVTQNSHSVVPSLQDKIADATNGNQDAYEKITKFVIGIGETTIVDEDSKKDSKESKPAS